MSAAITQPYGTLAQLIASSASVHRKLDDLTQQASSGLKADSYAGLGASAHVSLDLHAQLNALQTWQSNIDTVSGSLQVTQSAMTQLQQIAANFDAQLNNLNGLDPQNVDVVAASARDALVQVANLLDSKDGDVYVFAGQDTGNPPVPDPDAIASSSSLFFTSIQGAVQGLSGSGASNTLTAAVGFATPGDPADPFSTYLSQPMANPTPPPANNINLQSVQIGPNQFQDVGLLASANTYAPSGSYTGSAMRDLMCSLAVVGSLSSSQANDPQFFQFVQDTRGCLDSAVNGLAVEAGALGNVQSSLTASQSRMSDSATALTAQVSSAEDADMAETLSKLSQVQTQLQASYQLIAGLSGLSLAKYLPAG